MAELNTNPETNPKEEEFDDLNLNYLDLDELDLDEIDQVEDAPEPGPGAGPDDIDLDFVEEVEEEERDEVPPGSPPVPGSPTPLQRQPWPLVMSIGAVVIAVLAFLTAGFALRPASELDDFRKEIVQTVDGKIASATEAITAKADAAITAASDIKQQQEKMMDDIIRISLQQKATADNVVSLVTRVVAVESGMDKYKKSIDRYNSAMRMIAEQSARANALARTALGGGDIRVFITNNHFLFDHSDLTSAMKQELDIAGFRDGSKTILGICGTADAGKKDGRNYQLVQERARNGADWIGSAANAKGGEYPAVVDPFDGANCRKLVIVYRLAAASATQ